MRAFEWYFGIIMRDAKATQIKKNIYKHSAARVRTLVSIYP